MSNNSLHNYIEQDEELKHKSNQLREEYDKSIQALSQQRQKAMDEAKITNARLQKYIPQILKSQYRENNFQNIEYVFFHDCRF